MLLPPELVQHVLFLLVAQDPLASLAVLNPFLTANRAFNAAVNDPALHARIFRLKFDVGAVERRLFRPAAADLKDQLDTYSKILAAVRRGVPSREERLRQRDHAAPLEDDMSDVLFGAMLMMFDNDGKNYAQLEHAGIHNYIHDFVFTHLWEGCESNNGWPIETTASASALWLAWLTIDRSRLLRASPADREKFILAINPFVFLVHRYPSSVAPPNHFNLPLNETARFTYTLPMTDIKYPHYLPDRSGVIPYFRALHPLSAPLISIAARLLFVAYRELRPFMVPGHLPRNAEEARRRWWAGQQAAQQEAADIAALVATGMPHAEAMAEVQARALPFPDPLPPVPNNVTPPTTLGPTQEDYHALNRGRAATLPPCMRWDWDVGYPSPLNNEESETEDPVPKNESVNWDTTWWRMRLCSDYTAPQPRFSPGAVFERGAMRGKWKGKIYIPQGNMLGLYISQNPPYPTNLFTESSLGVIMQPFILSMSEASRVCGCTDGAQKPPNAPNNQCGVIPIPQPVSLDWRNLPFDGVLPQDLPAGHPHHVGFAPGGGNANQQEHTDMDSSGARYLIMPKLDYSMSNAWMPCGIGGLTYITRAGSSIGPFSTSDGPIFPRDEMVISLTHEEPSFSTKATCPALSDPLASQSPQSQQPGQFVYEVFDPTRVSAHDIHHEPGPAGSTATVVGTNERVNPDCARCVKREEIRRRMRAKDDDEARRSLEHRAEMAQLLEEAMAKWGTGAPANAKTEELDISELGLSSGEEEDSGVLGDDHVDEFARREFERARVTSVCSPCAHASDTIFTGETPPEGLAWTQHYTTYGRLRPWDGLIGLIRIGRSPANYIFIFGYIVGGATFVGEWRAAASDPMRPAWGGPFVMSRVQA